MVAAASASARSVYTLDYASRTRSDLRALFGVPEDDAGTGLVQDIDSHLDAELEQVATVSAGERLMIWHLRNARARLRINGIDAAEHAQSIATRLQAGAMIAVLDAEGLVVGLRLPANMDEPTRAYARALFAAIQFAEPRRRAKQWDTREEDQSGRYIARYRRTEGTVVRTRMSYLPERPLLAGETRVVQKIEPRGSTRASFAANGDLLSLEGDETQRVLVAKKVIATGSTTLRLRRASPPTPLARSERAALAALLVGFRDVPAESLSTASSAASTETSLHRQELGGDTLDSLLAQLRGFHPAEPGSRESTGLYLKFKALVVLQPETSNALAAELALSPSDSESMLILSQALAAGGHAPAQTALVSVIRQRSDDWPAMAALVPVLGSVPLPEDASVATLQSLASESRHPMIASTAMLALGTAAKHLLANAPARGARLVDWMLTRLAQSDSPAGRREVLLALGNAADARTLLAATRHAGDSDPGVRAAAMSALRWIDASGARALLRERLARDPVAEVRLAAAQALGAQRMDAAGFSAQRQAFERDAEDHIRIVLLQTLWAAVDEFPQARAVVEAAHRDAAESVRAAAKRLR